MLNKADLVPAPTLESLEALLRRLNPGADIIRATYTDVPVGGGATRGLLPSPLYALPSASWL